MPRVVVTATGSPPYVTSPLPTWRVLITALAPPSFFMPSNSLLAADPVLNDKSTVTTFLP